METGTESGKSLKIGRRFYTRYWVCWSYGFSDETYNFTVNTGYDDEGELVLIDPGEISFSQKEVRKHVKNQRWLGQWSYSDDISENLKPYFKRRMGEELTEEKLDSLWRENC